MSQRADQGTRRHGGRGLLSGAHRLLVRLRGSASGTTAAEFAIVLPVFLLILMGLIEFGRLFWVQSSLRHAVEQTARLAMAEYTREFYTNDNFSTWFASWPASLQGSAPDQIFGLDSTGITFTATTSQTGGIDYVTITATSSFDFVFPVIPGTSSKTLTALSKTPLIT